MSNGLRNLFLTLILAICASTIEAKADQIFDLFLDKTIERCEILQPLDTIDVVTFCRGSYITSQRLGDDYVLRLGTKNPPGFTYRFHGRLDEEQSRQRFESLRKVAELCFSAGSCKQMAELSDKSSDVPKHWSCEGSPLTIELELVWVIDESTLALGEFRNLYLCLEASGVRGIVQPFFNPNPIGSRPDFYPDDHFFSYFELDLN